MTDAIALAFALIPPPYRSWDPESPSRPLALSRLRMTALR